ncbi:MAG: helix-turn-helix domain-containing protein [Hyphomonadaceae bacterium]|nr:helix-turn-helix domain-containing protein [Hyphomonadaceae bacterium]
MLSATAKTRKIVGLVYPGAVLLDLAAPMEVFHFASDTLGEETGAAPAPYDVEIWGLARGPVPSMSGLSMMATSVLGDSLAGIDTVLVPGAKSGNPDVYRDRRILDWLQGLPGQVRRIVAVGSGAFLLAEAGLLRGRRATTHWRDSDLLKRGYPDVTVLKDVIFTADGPIYSSAGVVGAIDQALALVEEDHGRTASLKVAKRLVVLARRPGDHTQLSSFLSSQTRSVRFGELLDWIYRSLRADLSVPRLAEMAAMSPRNFTRVFREELGRPPAEFVRAVRVEVASRLIAEGNDMFGAVSRECGFASEEQMRRAFQAVLKLSPRDFHDRNAARGKLRAAAR